MIKDAFREDCISRGDQVEERQCHFCKETASLANLLKVTKEEKKHMDTGNQWT